MAPSDFPKREAINSQPLLFKNLEMFKINFKI